MSRPPPAGHLRLDRVGDVAILPGFAHTRRHRARLATARLGGSRVPTFPRPPGQPGSPKVETAMATSPDSWTRLDLIFDTVESTKKLWGSACKERPKWLSDDPADAAELS